MDDGLSKSGAEALQHWADRAGVLHATVEQLRKDLSMDAGELPVPPVGEETFEALRSHVLPRLETLQHNGPQALRTVLYRVDIPEAHLHRTTAAGGLHALAGECVLRCLQKVLTRMRFAGRL